MSKNAKGLAAAISAKAGPAPVEIGLILGSGLGHIANEVDGVAIPYSELSGFPHAGVSGHNPNLVIGDLEGVRVAVFGGRAHYYESGRGDAMRLPLEVLKELGADRVIATNAAGSMRADMPTGSIMCLSDHINFSGLNPLIGEPTDARFVPMKDAYDPALRAGLRAAADATGTDMADGIYAWYSGPSFETPAEIRAIRMLGADAVGRQIHLTHPHGSQMTAQALPPDICFVAKEDGDGCAIHGNDLIDCGLLEWNDREIAHLHR